MLSQTTTRPAAGCATQRQQRQAVLTRASQRFNGVSKTIEQAATTLLAAGVAVSLGLGAPSAALAKPMRLADKVAEKEAAKEYQLSRLEYAIQQQETAARAEIAGKRQQLENTAQQVDTASQRKLTEEAANQQAAAKKGEEQRALRIEQEAAHIKQQEAQIQVAVAKAEAQLDREEIVEKAREVEQKQEVKKAENSIMGLLGLSEADLGL